MNCVWRQKTEETEEIHVVEWRGEASDIGKEDGI